MQFVAYSSDGINYAIFEEKELCPAGENMPCFPPCFPVCKDGAVIYSPMYRGGPMSIKAHSMVTKNSIVKSFILTDNNVDYTIDFTEAHFKTATDWTSEGIPLKTLITNRQTIIPQGIDVTQNMPLNIVEDLKETVLQSNDNDDEEDDSNKDSNKDSNIRYILAAVAAIGITTAGIFYYRKSKRKVLKK